MGQAKTHYNTLLHLVSNLTYQEPTLFGGLPCDSTDIRNVAVWMKASSTSHLGLPRLRMQLKKSHQVIGLVGRLAAPVVFRKFLRVLREAMERLGLFIYRVISC